MATFNKYLTTDFTGNPNGTNQAANGDYGTLTPFGFTVTQGSAFVYEFRVLAAATADIGIGEYAPNTVFDGSEGLEIVILDPDGVVKIDVTQSERIKTFTRWGRFAPIQKTAYRDGFGWHVAGRVPSEYPIIVPAGFTMAFRLLGDFSSLSQHEFLITGAFRN